MRNNYKKVTMVLIITVLAINAALINVNAQTTPVQTDVPALKNVFKDYFDIGCLLSYAHIGFRTDPYVDGQSSVVTSKGGTLIQYHMNTMSPGNWMKSTYIVDINGSAAAYANAQTQQEKDSIDVNPIVKFNGNIIAQLNWAKRQGFAFRGHTLVWHSQNPGTTFFRSGYTSDGERLSKEMMTKRMENYIKEVIRIIHEGWPNMLIAMDVVNEAINEDGSDRTTDSEFYQTFGDNTYVMKAFEFARKYTIEYGETQMKLYYNDYRTHVTSKANGIVRLCGPIYRAGYLDGIGMQEHDGLYAPLANQWITSYNKFDTICTEMTVTEFDVAPGNPINNTAQAYQYANLFKCFMDKSAKAGKGKVVNVTKDGLNDEWAFVKNASLWDNENQCKEAFYEVVEMAQNYVKLDSLIASTDTLNQQYYDASLWAAYLTELENAKTAFEQNYSATVSAADGLGDAIKNLTNAINKLQGISGIETISNTKTELGQNYPNPFSNFTTIDININNVEPVKLVIYDKAGRVVLEPVINNLKPGFNKISIDASQLSADVYIYSIFYGNNIMSKKMVVVK